MKKAAPLLGILCLVLFSVSCASTKAINDIDTNPDNIARGDSTNPIKVKEYLGEVLLYPEGRELEAFTRKPFSPDVNKNLFYIHSFYVFLNGGELEHTLVFTKTPKGSELDGTWMLDASTDVESYNLYLDSDNPWELEEIKGKDGEDIALLETSRNILERLEEERRFTGTAGLRDIPWYHHLWMIWAPPPILGYSGAMIASIGADNCNTAVSATIAWE